VKARKQISRWQGKEPGLITLKGRIGAPGIQVQALDSESGWAALSDGEGRFNLIDVCWFDGVSFRLVFREPDGGGRMIKVDGPSEFPDGAVLELGDIDLREARQLNHDYDPALSATSRQDFDEANASYYRELFNRLSSDKQSDEERILAVNRHVAGKLNYEERSPSSSRRAVLERGSRFCGDLAGAMATVLAAANFKTRQIDMTGGGESPGTHVVVEVYYDGGWHLFDPTYDAVYRRRDGQVASYQDLRCEPALISREHFARLDPGSRRGVFGLMLAVYGSGHHHYYEFKDRRTR
jgi:hypothetical protein